VNILNALKGVSEQPEIIRVIGAYGALVFITTTPLFVWLLPRFELVAYCAAFPAGIVAVVGGIAGATSLKDRNVATAKATQAATDAVTQGTNNA